MESEYFNHLDVVLQQMFPDSSAKETDDEMETLTSAYHRYKREYVKHVSFNPWGEENLGKYLFDDDFAIVVSHRSGSCPLGICVHLL